jgi:hypothetical protein
LVLVPTVFAVVPEAAAGMPLWSRALLLAVWSLVGLTVVLASAGRDSLLEALMRRHRQERREADQRAAATVLESLLQSGTHGTPPKYTWTVYLYDQETSCLLPVFPDPSTDPHEVRAFHPGNGATGIAFQSPPGTVVLITGAAVSDGSHGLRPDQQEAYRPYRTVVATRIEGKMAQSALCQPLPGLETTTSVLRRARPSCEIWRE